MKTATKARKREKTPTRPCSPTPLFRFSQNRSPTRYPCPKYPPQCGGTPLRLLCIHEITKPLLSVPIPSQPKISQESLRPPISMKARIPNILPHAHQEHLHLLRRPAKRPREKPHRHPLQALEELFAVEEADGFEVLLLRPGTHGELAGDFGDTDEAGVGEELLQMGGDVEATIHFRGGFS